MKLFVSPTSPFARLVMVVAYRKHIDLSLVFVNPWENSAELATATPFSQVPALLTDDDVLITESSVIIGFLAPEFFADSRTTSQLSYSISLISQAVRAFATQRFQPDSGEPHPFIERSESILSAMLPKAPMLEPLSEDWGQIFLGIALTYVQLRLPEIFQTAVSTVNQDAVAKFAQRDFMQKTHMSNLEKHPASILAL